MPRRRPGLHFKFSRASVSYGSHPPNQRMPARVTGLRWNNAASGFSGSIWYGPMRLSTSICPAWRSAAISPAERSGLRRLLIRLRFPTLNMRFDGNRRDRAPYTTPIQRTSPLPRSDASGRAPNENGVVIIDPRQ